jgi:hypothetical protein
MKMLAVTSQPTLVISSLALNSYLPSRPFDKSYHTMNSELEGQDIVAPQAEVIPTVSGELQFHTDDFGIVPMISTDLSFRLWLDVSS